MAYKPLDDTERAIYTVKPPLPLRAVDDAHILALYNNTVEALRTIQHVVETKLFDWEELCTLNGAIAHTAPCNSDSICTTTNATIAALQKQLAAIRPALADVVAARVDTITFAADGKVVVPFPPETLIAVRHILLGETFKNVAADNKISVPTMRGKFYSVMERVLWGGEAAYFGITRGTTPSIKRLRKHASYVIARMEDTFTEGYSGFFKRNSNIRSAEIDALQRVAVRRKSMGAH